MPAYEYVCATCGQFTASRSMAAFAEPADCPTCGGSAPRLLLSAPFLGGQPRSRLGAAAAAPSARHAAGCGCCGSARIGKLRAEALQNLS